MGGSQKAEVGGRKAVLRSQSSDLSAAPQTVTARVSWHPSAGATGYKVYHTASLAQPFTVAATTSSNSVTIAGLPWGAGFFHVTATNQWGESR